MAHPLIQQIHLTRSLWREGFTGVTEADGTRRFEPINSIGWMVGHLAAHEQRIWLDIAQGTVEDEAVYACGGGQPASTPSLDAMIDAWERIIAATDSYLNALTQDDMTRHLERDGQPLGESIGAMAQRMIYHYWYHLGEMQAVRQLLGHTGLRNFVGRVEQSLYSPEI